MKKSIKIVLFSTVFFLVFSCEKTNVTELNSLSDNGHLKQTKTYNSTLVVKWLKMQLEMLRVPLPAGTGSQASDRCQAYCGIALYQAVLPGMPSNKTMEGQLTDFPTMPIADKGKAYNWAISANAALAEMNRKLFPTTADVNKTNMDNLEASILLELTGQSDEATIARSVAYGKEVASRVFNWAVLDGSNNVNPAYVPPTGPGLWVPTATTPPVNPYAFQRRLLVPNVENGTALAPPPAYSADPASPFFAMVKEVYDQSIVNTADQVAAAIYFRDAPGYPGGGHFVSIMAQVIETANANLSDAALAYLKVGIAQHDATITLFKNKYAFNLIRPITYIRNEMGFPTWNTTIPTPNHPEFPSGHAVSNASIIVMLNQLFGTTTPITLHTYDYLGFPARSYSSFDAMGNDMTNSRFYGGLHYKATCDKSVIQGRKVANNILNTVVF